MLFVALSNLGAAREASHKAIAENQGDPPALDRKLTVQRDEHQRISARRGVELNKMGLQPAAEGSGGLVEDGLHDANIRQLVQHLA
jgi:hypothetical protein